MAALDKRPQERGIVRWLATDPAPADSSNMVMRPRSPLKDRMFSCTQRMAHLFGPREAEHLESNEQLSMSDVTRRTWTCSAYVKSVVHRDHDHPFPWDG